jgi:hypothetical protein
MDCRLCIDVDILHLELPAQPAQATHSDLAFTAPSHLAVIVSGFLRELISR